MHKEKLLENDNKYQEQDGEQEKLKLVKEAINCITGCCFDNGCILMFKKLRNRLANIGMLLMALNVIHKSIPVRCSSTCHSSD